MTGYIEEGENFHAWITIDGQRSEETIGNLYDGVLIDVALGDTTGKILFDTGMGGLLVHADLRRPSGRVVFESVVRVGKQS